METKFFWGFFLLGQKRRKNAKKKHALQAFKTQQEKICGKKNLRFRIQDWWFTCDELVIFHEMFRMILRF